MDGVTPGTRLRVHPAQNRVSGDRLEGKRHIWGAGRSFICSHNNRHSGCRAQVGKLTLQEAVTSPPLPSFSDTIVHPVATLTKGWGVVLASVLSLALHSYPTPITSSYRGLPIRFFSAVLSPSLPALPHPNPLLLFPFILPKATRGSFSNRK